MRRCCLRPTTTRTTTLITHFGRKPTKHSKQAHKIASNRGKQWTRKLNTHTHKTINKPLLLLLIRPLLTFAHQRLACPSSIGSAGALRRTAHFLEAWVAFIVHNRVHCVRVAGESAARLCLRLAAIDHCKWIGLVWFGSIQTRTIQLDCIEADWICLDCVCRTCKCIRAFAGSL